MLPWTAPTSCLFPFLKSPIQMFVSGGESAGQKTSSSVFNRRCRRQQLTFCLLFLYSFTTNGRHVKLPPTTISSFFFFFFDMILPNALPARAPHFLRYFYEIGILLKSFREELWGMARGAFLRKWLQDSLRWLLRWWLSRSFVLNRSWCIFKKMTERMSHCAILRSADGPCLLTRITTWLLQQWCLTQKDGPILALLEQTQAQSSVKLFCLLRRRSSSTLWAVSLFKNQCFLVPFIFFSSSSPFAPVRGRTHLSCCQMELVIPLVKFIFIPLRWWWRRRRFSAGSAGACDVCVFPLKIWILKRGSAHAYLLLLLLASWNFPFRK